MACERTAWLAAAPGWMGSLRSAAERVPGSGSIAWGRGSRRRSSAIGMVQYLMVIGASGGPARAMTA